MLARAGPAAGGIDLDATLGHAPPDRLSAFVALYLLLPGLIWCASWLAAPWVAGAALAAGIGALALAPGWWRRPWPFGGATTAACLALGLLWAGGSGTHHLLYSVADWQIRDAVLRDLTVGPWPVAYAVGEQHWLLRAPLGFYMPAALVGRALGFGAAQAALWVWCGLGLGLVVALLAALARDLAGASPRRRWRAALLLGGVFLLFGGLDLLPNLWLDWRAGVGAFASWGRGGEWWDRLFQYSGHVTLLLWVPNHALPAWLAALLLLRHGREAGFLRAAALPVAAGSFWSPLGAFGAAVLTAAAMLPGWRAVRRGPALAGALGAVLRTAFAAPNLLAALFALPIALYLTAGSEAIPHGPLLWRHDAPWEAAGRWLLLLVVEVLPWVALAVPLLRRGGRLFRVSVAMLCLLPGYVFGPGNEMTMRGGIAPVAVLAVAVGAALLAPVQDRRARRAARAGLILCLAVAAAGSVVEGSLLVTHRPWAASRDCSLPRAARQSVFEDTTDWSHYVVRWPPPEAWLPRLLADPVLRPEDPEARGSCWPDGRV